MSEIPWILRTLLTLTLCVTLDKALNPSGLVPFFFFFLIYLFLFGCVGSSLLRASELSLAAASGGDSSLWSTGFSLRWLLLLRSTGSRRVGFSSCSTQAQ